MNHHKHLFSESGTWLTESDFVTPAGSTSSGKGQTTIILSGDKILVKSWVQFEVVRRVNNYTIQILSDTNYEYVSENPELGTQIGTYRIEGDTVYSEFHYEGTKMRGKEKITRTMNECVAEGELYKDEYLVNTWTATMKLETPEF